MHCSNVLYKVILDSFTWVINVLVSYVNFFNFFLDQCEFMDIYFIP